MLCDWANNEKALSITRPMAGAITFAKLNLDIKSEEFIFSLRDDYSVLLTAGKWHGMDGYIRFGYGTPTEYVMNGLKRVSKYLKSFN